MSLLTQAHSDSGQVVSLSEFSWEKLCVWVSSIDTSFSGFESKWALRADYIYLLSELQFFYRPMVISVLKASPKPRNMWPAYQHTSVEILQRSKLCFTVNKSKLLLLSAVEWDAYFHLFRSCCTREAYIRCWPPPILWFEWVGIYLAEETQCSKRMRTKEHSVLDKRWNYSGTLLHQLFSFIAYHTMPFQSHLPCQKAIYIFTEKHHVYFFKTMHAQLASLCKRQRS